MNLTETHESSYSETPNQNENNAPSPLSVTPNPATDYITVKLTEPQTATILLLDPAGTALIRKRIYYRAEVQLDLREITPGAYTVVAEYYGQTYSEKIAVARS